MGNSGVAARPSGEVIRGACITCGRCGPQRVQLGWWCPQRTIVTIIWAHVTAHPVGTPLAAGGHAQMLPGRPERLAGLQLMLAHLALPAFDRLFADACPAGKW